MATIKTYARPTTIYRYRSLATNRTVEGKISPTLLKRELEALKDRYIFCPTYREMNDPMEGFYQASQRVQSQPDYDDTVELIRSQKLQIGIASFSETWNNELMWAHYGGRFGGICIGYSVKKLLAGLSEHCGLARIAYDDRPYFLGLGALRGADRARAILSTKNLKWSYEREWRLFAPARGPSRYNNDAVSCVYLGARMSDADRERLKKRVEALGLDVRLTQVEGYAIKREGSE